MTIERKCEAKKRPILRGYDYGSKTIYVYQVTCGQWNCRYCGNSNRLQWAARIGEGVKLYEDRGVKDWTFATITMSKKLKNTSQCLYVWPKAWAKLSARLRRAFPGIRYVLIPELHNDGRVHFHAIMSHGVTTRWLKDVAPYCGLGFKAESELIDEENMYLAVWYVSKYLSKSLDVARWPKNLRRIRTSQGWPKLTDDESFDRMDIDWQYWLSYPPEGLDYLIHEMEQGTDWSITVI